MASRRRRRRSPARWLAPLALVAAGVAVYAVVGAGSQGTKSSSGAARTSTSAPGHAVKAKPSRRRARPRTYTVRAGDTLSGIATKTGVSLERIQQLNPKLDSQTLQTGETIKLGP